MNGVEEGRLGEWLIRTDEEVAGLAVAALAASRLPDLRPWASGLLVPPRREMRLPDHGPEGPAVQVLDRRRL